MNDTSGGINNSTILKIPKRQESFTKKTSLEKIVHKDQYAYVSGVIEDLANKINKLTTHAYHFLKLWILHKYHSCQKVPEITLDVLQLIFKVLIDNTKETKCNVTTKTKNKKEQVIKKEKGKSLTGDKLELYNNFVHFYDSEYKSTMSEDKVKLTNSQQLITFVTRGMLTNIENNIKKHFFKYIFAFVNISFKIDETNENIPESEIIKQKQELRRELFLVKMDLVNNTMKSDPKYHDWIKNIKDKILPCEYEKSYDRDLILHPQKYLKYMIFMNIQLELAESKMYHVLPLRAESIIKYIPLDTKILIQYLVTENRKDKYLYDITFYADEMWAKYFKTSSGLFQKTGYKFKHLIYTDGVGASISFSSDELYEKDVKKYKNKKAKKMKNIEECKDKTKEEKEEFKKNKTIEKKLKEEADKEKKMDENEAFKLECKKKRTDESKQKVEKTETERLKLQKEFPYLDDLTETQINNLKKCNLVYIDPGKIRLYTMIDDNNQIFKYSNKEYNRRIKKDKYYKKLTKLREKLQIIEKEKALSVCNSKSCQIEKFKTYVVTKNEVNLSLSEEYRKKIFRQYKWYSYIMKQREMDRLIYIIKQTYGENCKLIMGDWSPSIQMKNFSSTPMIGLKRKLRKGIEIINLNEFNTSKLNYVTKEECENLVLPVMRVKRDKNNKPMLDENNKEIKERVMKKIHSILTYQMEENRTKCTVEDTSCFKKRKVCINRDINSVKNMRTIVTHWLSHKERPKEFSRKEEVPKKVKTPDGKPKKVLKEPKSLNVSLKKRKIKVANPAVPPKRQNVSHVSTKRDLLKR